MAGITDWGILRVNAIKVRISKMYTPLEKGGRGLYFN
jgi:hypothetical protein